MASFLLHPSTISTTLNKKPYFQPSIPQLNPTHFTSKHYFPTKPSQLLKPHQNPYPTPPKSSHSHGFLENNKKDESLLLIQHSPVKFLLWVCLWASVSVAVFAFAPGDAKAAVGSIKGLGLGLKVAGFLRGSGWPDPAVVFALATLPVVELRGAIPVGYWLRLNPVVVTALSVFGEHGTRAFNRALLETICNVPGQGQQASGSAPRPIV